ncbi:nuclear transport factor 2 family protein [bacterium]|nr:nuclear transport factor 2 family protein [bacterium]
MILKSARDFEAAFNAGDAKAVGALYTENAESRDDGGRPLTGRAAIEKAFADFFAANRGAKIEVLVRSVRFPAPGMAVEEGLLRQTRGPKELPRSTAYVAVHSRDGGRWRVALASESGAGQDRLEDLDWLLGEWKTTAAKGDGVSFAFARDAKRPVVTGTFTRTPAGKAATTGSIRIALDPESRQIRSWGFEDDGAHSQALWATDGKSWIVDGRGVLADGTPFGERVLLQRVGPDAITWRAVDRVLGDDALPDTPPVRLTRVAPTK